MSEFTKFINHEGSPEAYITTMLTSFLINLLIFSIIFHKLFHLNTIINILLTYIISLTLAILIINSKSKLFIPYFIIDYTINLIPILREIIYYTGTILMLPAGYALSFIY